VIPIALYFAWPAIEDRGFSTGGNRNVLLLWGGALSQRRSDDGYRAPLVA